MTDPFYAPHQLVELQQGYSTVNRAYERLLAEYLSLRLSNQAAYEYARHGFARRLGTLKRCIENVYSIYPPERSDKPSREECLDLAINLQSFMFNVFGCIDNLAWIWVKEKDVRDKQDGPLRAQQIGLRSGCIAVRNTFSVRFSDYLSSRDDWFSHLEDYRHALAHRIPLYVAPYTLSPAKLDDHNELERRKNEAHAQRDYDLWLKLDADQEELGRFTTYMMHSFFENASPVAFHFQMLADWNTVFEMADEFRSEINPFIVAVSLAVTPSTRLLDLRRSMSCLWK
jgi:hypothetical protein